MLLKKLNEKNMQMMTGTLKNEGEHSFGKNFLKRKRCNSNSLARFTKNQALV